MALSTSAQLQLLFKRAWLLRKANLWQLILECLLSLLLVVIAVVVVGLKSEQFVDGKESANESKDSALYNKSIILALSSPSDSTLRSIVEQSKAICPFGNYYVTSDYKSLRAALRNYVNSNSTISNLIAGVYLERRTNETIVKITSPTFLISYKTVTYFDGTRSKASRYRLGYGRSEIQSCFEQAASGSSAESSANVELRALPYVLLPNHAKWLQALITSGWLISAFFMLRRIERDKRSIYQIFRRFDVSSSIFWFVHFVNAYAIVLLHVLIGSIVISIPFAGNSAVFNAHYLLVLIVMITSSVALIAVAILIAAWCNGRAVLWVTFALYWLSALIPHDVLSMQSTTQGYYAVTGLPLLACFVPTMAFEWQLERLFRIGRHSDGAPVRTISSDHEFLESEVTLGATLLIQLSVIAISALLVIFFHDKTKKTIRRLPDSFEQWSPKFDPAKTSSVVMRQVSKDLTDAICKQRVLNGITLNVSAKSLFIILSTEPSSYKHLLRCISGEETPDSGTVFVNGSNVYQTKPRVGFAPDIDAFDEQLTVHDNIQMYLKLKGIEERNTEKEIRVMLELIKSSAKRDVPMAKLSSSRRQRIAIAIALLGDSKLLLLDDPIHMGLKSASMCWELIKRFSADATVIVGTSNVTQSLKFGGNVALLVGGQLRPSTTASELTTVIGDHLGHRLTYKKKPKFDVQKMRQLIKEHFQNEADLRVLETPTEFDLKIKRKQSAQDVMKFTTAVANNQDVVNAVLTKRIEFSDAQIFKEIYKSQPNVLVKQKRVHRNATFCAAFKKNLIERSRHVYRSLQPLAVTFLLIFALLYLMLIVEHLLMDIDTSWRRNVALSSFYGRQATTVLFDATNAAEGNDTGRTPELFYARRLDGESRLLRPLTSDVSEFVKNRIKKEEKDICIGASFDKSTATAWSCSDSVHSPPLSLHYAHDAIHAANQTQDGRKLTLIREAINQPHLKQLFIAQPLAMVYAIFVGIALAIFLSTTAKHTRLFHTTHAIYRDKLLHTIAFFAASFLLDYILYSCFVIMFVISCYSFGSPLMHHGGATVLLLLVAGVPMLLFAYILAYSAGEFSDFIILLLAGTCFALCSSYVELWYSKKPDLTVTGIMVSKCLNAVLQISPIHSLLTGLRKIVSFATSAQVCRKVNRDTLQSLCGSIQSVNKPFLDIGFSDKDIYHCCADLCNDTCLTTNRTVLRMGKHGIGFELSTLLLVTLIAIIFILFTETRKKT